MPFLVTVFSETSYDIILPFLVLHFATDTKRYKTERCSGLWHHFFLVDFPLRTAFLPADFVPCVDSLLPSSVSSSDGRLRRDRVELALGLRPRPLRTAFLLADFVLSVDSLLPSVSSSDGRLRWDRVELALGLRPRPLLAAFFPADFVRLRWD